ncbi:MAG: hypothetical protein Rhirs2KO_31080 [Rhizobiaceae bacterium]
MTSVRERQKKAERTSEIAFGIINAEADAREAKTAKLRKLREAGEAGSKDVSNEAANTAAKKRRVARKPRRVGP